MSFPLISRQLGGLTCFSLFHYKSPVDQFIRAAKKGKCRQLSKDLGKILARKLILETRLDFQAVAPIPARNSKKDHAYYLAESVSCILNQPLFSDGKKEIFGEQKNKNSIERQSVEFTLAEKLKRSPVIIVDDVITTGATLAHFYEALGKPSALAATVASTPSP